MLFNDFQKDKKNLKNNSHNKNNNTKLLVLNINQNQLNYMKII